MASRTQPEQLWLKESTFFSPRSDRHQRQRSGQAVASLKSAGAVVEPIANNVIE